MAVCRRVYPVNNVCSDVNSAVKAECDVCTVDIIVDRLWQTYNIKTLLTEQVRRLVCAVTSQSNKAVKLHLLVILFHCGNLVNIVLFNYAHIAVGLAAGSENCAAQRQQSRKIIRLHNMIRSVDKTLVSVVDTNELHVHKIERGVSHSPDSGVQSRTVSSARQNADSAFSHSLLPPAKIKNLFK